MGKAMGVTDVFFTDREAIADREFVREALEQTERIGPSLLALREGRGGAELATLFRAVHTLKGAAYAVGRPVVGDLAHRIEDVLADVRDRRRALTPAVMEALLISAAALLQLVRSAAEGRPAVTAAPMVPVGDLFARFARQVREAARAVGRRVVVEPTGEAMELDGALAEPIADVLLHLARNAVAHGIEPEEERRVRGKPPYGTVRLGAFPRGMALHIEVADDGRGIDVEAVKAQALRRGLVTAEMLARLGERELLDLVFLPGLSTVRSVTAASGRGVGLDVARTTVAGLGGAIDVESRAGHGTRFTIRFPSPTSAALMV